MYKYTIEYWYRTKWGENDKDEAVILAKNEKEAMRTLHNTKRVISNIKILSVTKFNN